MCNAQRALAMWGRRKEQEEEGGWRRLEGEEKKKRRGQKGEGGWERTEVAEHGYIFQFVLFCIKSHRTQHTIVSSYVRRIRNIEETCLSFSYLSLCQNLHSRSFFSPIPTSLVSISPCRPFNICASKAHYIFSQF